MPRRAGVICRVENRVFNSSGNWEVKGKAFKIVYLNDLSKRLSGEKWIDHSAAGLSSPGVPGMPWHPQILTDNLTLSQPGGTDYAHQIILAPPDFQAFLRPCAGHALVREIPSEKSRPDKKRCNNTLFSQIVDLWHAASFV